MPWGEPVNNKKGTNDNILSISDLQNNGEIIMLTISGPDTYFDYHGRGMGIQYQLFQKFSQEIGVSLRVELCKSTNEMLLRLKNGDADIIVYQIRDSDVIACGYRNNSDSTAWAVNKKNRELAERINKWFKPELLTEIKREEQTLLATPLVHKRTYAPMLNAEGGIISKYDHLFKRYSPIARWDWRLMAAQCYQESGFDNKAFSWAGAKGLMQIMPQTAEHLGLQEDEIYDPEQNIYAAARYIAELNNHFRDIRNPVEKQFFVMASYNGGYFHIRDAMRLTEKHGKNKYKWNDVAESVLHLQEKEYYTDEVVKYGYMRGYETVNYVNKIRDRWHKYCGKAKVRSEENLLNDFSINNAPKKAKKKHRFKL